MGNEVVAEPEWDRLDRLQRSLLAAASEEGAALPGGAGRGVRLRLARMALEQAIRRDAAESERRRREEFEDAVAALMGRVARWAPVALPPPPPLLPLPPAAPAAVPAPAPATQRRTVPGTVAAPAPSPSAAPARPRRARRPRPVPVPPPTFWSPGVVLGFRLWEVGARLRGACTTWDRPEFTASCCSDGVDTTDDVPHTDGRCGYPPCGIYCFKEAEQLLAAFGLPRGKDRRVLAVVSLSGKVVEHDRGYRAQRARVVAAAVVGRGRIIRIEGDARLQALFARPEATIDGLLSADPGVVEEVGDPVRMAEAVAAYLGLVRDFHESGGR